MSDSELDYIPVSKVARASRFARTGLKVGGNFVRHYARKVFSSESEDQLKARLHEDNATDIYQGLSQLKGSALKVLQMMSSDQNLLPGAYTERFALSQFSAPPLSYPLVEQTFRKAFGATPGELFKQFSPRADYAASIGQVHIGALEHSSGDLRRVAVKVQYPGIADSIEADLRIVRPFAIQLFNLNSHDVDYFLVEVRDRLLEETDYRLELRRGSELGDSCSNLPGLIFPRYYPEFSADRILTMDWLEGEHLDQFLANHNPSQQLKDELGQNLWGFYHHQFHVLHCSHADPHPGNFLFRPDGKVAVLDFGCVKELEEEFYHRYFSMLAPGLVQDATRLDAVLEALGFLHSFDSAEERSAFRSIFGESIALLAKPFEVAEFDFGDTTYFQALYEFGERLSKHPLLRSSKVARGPRDGLYINRTYFGLYNLLHRLKSKIKVVRPEWLGGM